jgi:hypothetical protein
LLAIELAGGILIGFDSSKLILDRVDVLAFSITLFVHNIIDNFVWCLTIVYGPVDNSLKSFFWSELR